MRYSGYSLFVLLPAAIMFLSGAQQAAAAQLDLQCPSEVESGAMHIDVKEEGWLAFVPRALPLSAAGFAQGEPAMKAGLKPVASEKHADGLQVKWVFEGSYPHGKWLVCDYANGMVRYSHKMADDISACSVFYKQSKSGANSVSLIRCESK